MCFLTVMLAGKEIVKAWFGPDSIRVEELGPDPDLGQQALMALRSVLAAFDY